jgi:hypothetical protein
MFRPATAQNTRRARGPVGHITQLGLPMKGLNARDPFAVMGPEFAISLTNVIMEPYGARTRKGYVEWAANIPGAGPVPTVMSYYPASASAPAVVRKLRTADPIRMMFAASALPRTGLSAPAGKLFACRDGAVYDVTAGGVGPWTAETGVGDAAKGDWYTWLNFQNVAGSFLVATNDDGGYWIYNGTTWTEPMMGTGVGQIDGIDPNVFDYVMVFKKRLWFVEKDSTSAWYLPVSSLTGLAKEFNFGEQFKKGGKLVALVNWTVDGGEGIDDYLVAVSSQGDVVIYKGTDPDTVETFAMHGVWYVGPLPVGKRQIEVTGADVNILSQFGAVPLSQLVSATTIGQLEQKRLTYLIAPLVARLMRDYGHLKGWQIRTLAKEELVVIGVPSDSPEFGGEFFALKLTNDAWSLLKETRYMSFVNVDSAVFAGTLDGRVVRAFEGELDNAIPPSVPGVPISCQVTPAYQALGAPGVHKTFLLVRPIFVTTLTPTLTVQMMADYGPPKPIVVPTLPPIDNPLWDEGIWDEARWSGIQSPIKKWLGIHGVGFVGTVQLDYRCGGTTLLIAMDMWTEQGGVM